MFPNYSYIQVNIIIMVIYKLKSKRQYTYVSYLHAIAYVGIYEIRKLKIEFFSNIRGTQIKPVVSVTLKNCKFMTTNSASK